MSIFIIVVQMISISKSFYCLVRKWKYKWDITIDVGYWIHSFAINLKPLKLLRTTNLNSSLLVNEGLCKLLKMHLRHVLCTQRDNYPAREMKKLWSFVSF